MANHIQFSHTERCGKENTTDIFVDGEHTGTIRGSAMNYTVSIRGGDGFCALSLRDAKRRVRKLYEGV